MSARKASPIAAWWGLTLTYHRELTRQPVFGVVLFVGAIVVGLSPALAVFALGEGDALVLDLGASAQLFCLAFLSATAVAHGAAERLRDGTTPLVLTHTSPLVVIAGQLSGAALALAQASLVLGVILQWGVRHGPERLHYGVLTGAGLGLAGVFAAAVRASVRRAPVAGAAVGAATVLLPLALLGSLFLARDGSLLSEPTALNGVALAAAVLAGFAGTTFAALGLTLATRLPAEAAAVFTLLGFFLASLVQAGLGADANLARSVGGVGCVAAHLWLLGGIFRRSPLIGGLVLAGSAGWVLGASSLEVTPATRAALSWGGPALGWGVWVALRREGVTGYAGYLLGGVALFLGEQVLRGGILGWVVPDLQLFWVADAAYGDANVPLDYLARVFVYALTYVGGALGVGSFLLAGRELG
ncbi:MAG: hypothetical protein KDD82_16290 [Planctomycetes bacterium]|nr:hypothetical protein [Planctomycetota bacterium]